ncbi:MAG: alkaline phosphatase family protein [Actinomycetota bacterium]
MSKVLILGLDGVGHPMLEPAFAAGHAPRLKRILDDGASGVLKSTVPPYTPPGWTSIFTGVNPGRHGIFGFQLGNAQRPGGLVRLERVQAPALWGAANAQGKSVGVFNVPLTYPAPRVQGFAVSGMMTPGEGTELPSEATFPAELGPDIARVADGYEIDIPVNYNVDWKSTDIIERLSRNLTKKRRVLSWLLEGHDIDFLFAVIESPDRLMHVHYKYLDPSCEHFGRPEAGPIRERAWAFLDELDEMIGDMLKWVGPDGFTITASDHGFGPKDKDVNINVALRQWGMLSVGGLGAATKSSGMRKLVRSARKVLPKNAFEKAAGRAQIDWSRTKAFGAPVPQQGVYINLEGREPHGCVPQDSYDAVREEIIDRLLDLTDPDDGRPVVDRVFRREEVMDGPEAQLAPDLFPVCRAYSYELKDALHAPAVLEDRRELPAGFHHMDGIFGIAGPGIPARSGLNASVCDITPTALYLGGLAIPPVDGRPLTELLPETMVAARPVTTLESAVPSAGEDTQAQPYSPDEEAQVEQALKQLGYM